MKARILGKVWEVRFVPNLGESRGSCDSPSTPSKAIRILQSLRGEELLEVITHEFLHAADWHKDEEFVAQFAADLARLLTRLGYAKTDE